MNSNGVCGSEAHAYNSFDYSTTTHTRGLKIPSSPRCCDYDG
jgi:hypothetical protein